MMIENPILPGFHPDPSMCRVGKEIYIATSTFEWFPGVRIHRSEDLKNWQLVGDALTRRSQLDLYGVGNSDGVWAPCLTYHEGLFYLLYTNVLVRSQRFMDSYNYLVTASDPAGPWSEPVFLVGGGFDPSLFHDDDGRKWLVWTHRDVRPREDCPTKPRNFSGIKLQEYDPAQKKRIGEPVLIFEGTELFYTEGVHLYRFNSYYYLMTAEGGTGYGHAVTMARSKNISGPYEVDPQNPILTSSDDPDQPLQKAGRASLVELEDGSPWIAHLCARPEGENRRCILGRETALQACRWTDDGWLRLLGEGRSPRMQWPAPDVPQVPVDSIPDRIDFNSEKLHPVLNTLRIPAAADWLSLNERSGWLRLYGQESPTSIMRQSVVGRRITSKYCQVSCCIEFNPKDYMQTAGLQAFYDTDNHYYLLLSRDENGELELRIEGMNQGVMFSAVECASVQLDFETGQVLMRFVLNNETLEFFWANECRDWNKIGPRLDATRLSDDYARGFTGIFAAIAAHDPVGRRPAADFEWFECCHFSISP